MATTNYERVGKALELLRDGLRPFIERELQVKYGKYWITEATKTFPNDLNWPEGADMPTLDAAALLRIMWDQWGEVFRNTLGFAERSLVSELREVRNKWAHQNTFSTDDAYRALDSVARLLTSISAPQAQEAEKSKSDTLRLCFDEQVRNEKRKTTGTLIETNAATNLKPWREVIIPHRDVASGQYQTAEFAADLWQVHLGEGTDEYRNPVEFFRRTYITESLKSLLAGAILRLSGTGGDPVVQLQTNFGGGKTHSMLALYHLFSGISPTELAGIDPVLKKAGTDLAPAARRVVLVGNKISPGNPSVKPDGTRVHTLWGELAWQLGGKPAYQRIQADDEKATNPGDVLRELFLEYGPCLILVDEWVAYARQLHDQNDLPAGSFETQFSFAQTLTESARLAKNCLLVISLPASDTTGSPHTHADDVEVGGQRGREALDRLRNVVGRLEVSWRPATSEEGFEIVRRRLFEPLADANQYKYRDTVANAFADLYRTQHAEFPPECRDADYENRIRSAYPIHPEIFDRLYTDWSTLIKFQRTRGVLRLMAAVIHSLWEKGDRSPLILPASIPIDDTRVRDELTRYLSDNWVPIIERDVDGPNSLPLRLDGDIPALGKFAASRRVARTIYLGSAPLAQAAHRGLEDRRVKLGCVMPGETPAVFGDALRRLASTATYLYQDGQRYWYATQPTVTKLAEDRAEQYRREPDRVIREVERRLRENLQKKGDFSRIHALPQSGQDVPDDFEVRLVVLGADVPYSRDAGSPAEVAAKAILEFRGSSPRIFQNTLVFLAADKTRMQDLDEAVRKFIAWETILEEKTILNLDPHQVKQAETQRASADGAVAARIPETYQWLLVPSQEKPQSAVEFQPVRLSGQEPLAVRASKKLRNDELLLGSFAPSRLRMELDKIPLWRGDHVAIKTLAEDFARFIYLPRLVDPSVLLSAVRGGVSLLTWVNDGFAIADSYDENESRYRGLVGGQGVAIMDPHSSSLLVKSEVAMAQISRDLKPDPDGGGVTPPPDPAPPGGVGPVPPPPPVTMLPKRFHGSVVLDTTRVSSSAGVIAQEVIAHLSGLVGSKVKVTLEIEADVENGIPENVVRTVTENSRTLKFTSQGFEKE